MNTIRDNCGLVRGRSGFLYQLLITFAALMFGAVASAQQVGEIAGKVTSASGGMGNVTVVAQGDVLPKPRRATTDGEGRYRLLLLPPGNYQVKFETADGQSRSYNVDVLLDQRTPLNVDLSGGMVEEVLVVGEVLTSTTNAALGNSIDADTLKSLPVGVDYSSLMRVIPGVQITSDSVRGPSAGASGQDNGYNYDGANLALPLFGTLSAKPSTHDVAYVSVERGGSKAVGFNRNAGFTMNTESKSGTNEFKGEVTYKLEKASWQAEDKDGVQFDDDIEYVTAGLGGPIVKDQLFFYGSYYRPTTSSTNGSNYRDGQLSDINNERDEYFGKLTWTPTEDILINTSMRTSEHTIDGGGVGTYDSATTASEEVSELDVFVFDGSWIINDSTTLNVSYTELEQAGISRPQTMLGLAVSEGLDLDVANLDTQGAFNVPGVDTRTGADAAEQALIDNYNVFIAPLIAAYGVIDPNEGLIGEGQIGGHPTIEDNRYISETFEISLDHVIETDSMTHELHVGYQEVEGSEELDRRSNGWGTIDVWGGIDGDVSGINPSDAYYRATVYTRGFGSAASEISGPLVSSVESTNIEFNDTITWGDWVFDVGFMLSNDEYIGQGLVRADTSSGWDVERGRSYVMKEVDFDETFQPRISATWNYSDTASVFASYSEYNPNLFSARAASWDRNTAGSTTRVYFDENGQFLNSEINVSSTGKLFAQDTDPRTVQEYMIGTSQIVSDELSLRSHLRYRRSWNYWEDTNNNARIVYDDPDWPSPEPKELYIPVNNLVGESTYVIAELQGAFTKYVEASLEAEYATGNFYLQGSLVWSHYWGNIDQDNTTRFNNDQSTFVGSSNVGDSWYGQLWGSPTTGDFRADKRWQTKLYGYYKLPWNANVGFLAYWQSGQKWELQNASTFYMEKRGSRETPSHGQLDLNYTQNFGFVDDKYNLEFRVDVFNIFDKQTPYNPEPRYNSVSVGEYRSHENPRRIQAALTFSF